MRIFALCLIAFGCGGDVVSERDVSPPQLCYPTEYGCSFCVPDAAPGMCGNIGRYDDAGVITLGCCLGATPVCRMGMCFQQ